MRIKQCIELKLTEAFSPVHMEVLDQSHLHEGHAGHNPKGESHFRVTLVSEAFRDMPRIRRHQSVYGCLSEELNSGVHALSLRLFVPGEEEAPGPQA